MKETTDTVDTGKIRTTLNKNKAQISLSLKLCVHCTLCAESCFLYMHREKDPVYMPSHKFINSLGRLYKKKGNIDRKGLEEIREVVWDRCVLCTRCYCPMGIDIPGMIALTRGICRDQGVLPQFDEE
ncbi:4Fe-4S dicluster domain-containing protein [Desulfocicer vacuolatum DSM 3385]|uniref:4Fe-4S dicluster domain-containing protein n=1 Tax=Desulfocicer vacuolatum DSM 3385 TaxID=1121400 RepID=A0A1W2BQS5_9BACT|nr:(Fe-S)-binding protein [Desulfocicer vacuolatum]SMC75279.1 4Fe-4S dicluster domain-containing protein [Desulfocicer vacuolatum DSM 3385]